MQPHVHGATRKLSALLATAFALAVSATAAAALFGVHPPQARPLGKTYSQHAANWWQWALSQPVDTSPLLDTTGEQCASGQSGSIWYLAGTVTGEPVVRSCTIPTGKHILFPVANAAYFAFDTDPPEQQTEEFLRAQVEFIRDATNLEVEIDGVPVPDVERFFERSTIFSVTLPENNIYDLPAGFVLGPSVDAGFYLALAPLPPGEHTIHFHAELTDGTIQDVTYNLTVSPGGRG
jgi:hypothetical protein